MNTILFCWIASLSATSCGWLLGLLTKVHPDNHFCSRYRKELKLMTSFAFLIALISGYLGSAENDLARHLWNNRSIRPHLAWLCRRQSISSVQAGQRV